MMCGMLMSCSSIMVFLIRFYYGSMSYRLKIDVRQLKALRGTAWTTMLSPSSVRSLRSGRRIRIGSWSVSRRLAEWCFYAAFCRFLS